MIPKPAARAKKPSSKILSASAAHGYSYMQQSVRQFTACMIHDTYAYAYTVCISMYLEKIALKLASSYIWCDYISPSCEFVVFVHRFVYRYVINETEPFHPSYTDFSVSLRSSASFSLNLPLLLALLPSILM